MGVDFVLSAVKKNKEDAEKSIGFRQWELYRFIVEHCDEAKIIADFLRKNRIPSLIRMIRSSEEEIISEPKELLKELAALKDALKKASFPCRHILLINGKESESFTGYTKDSWVRIYGRFANCDIRPLLIKEITEKNLDEMKRKLIKIEEEMSEAVAKSLGTDVNKKLLDEKKSQIKKMPLEAVRKEFSSLKTMDKSFKESARKDLLKNVKDGKLRLYSSLGKNNEPEEPAIIEEREISADLSGIFKYIDQMIDVCNYAIKNKLLVRGYVA